MSSKKHEEAIRLYEMGRTVEAIRLLALALTECETGEAWNDWAVMVTSCSLFAEAEEGYRRALDLEPRFTQASANLALLLASLDRAEEAIPLFERVEREQGKQLQPELKSVLKQCRARLKGVPRQPDYDTLAAYLKLFASNEKNLRIYFEGHLHRYLGTLAFLPAASGPGRRALELGTAYHYMTPALIRWKGYGEVSCADIWDGEPRCTRRVVSADGKEEYEFKIDNFDLQAPKWPYPDASFDLVLLCEILEHLVADPMNVIAEINRVLKIGGQFLLTVPNIASAKGVESVLVGESPYIYGKYQPGGRPTDRHNREYAPHELKRLAAAGGFETLKLQTHNSWWKHGTELSRLAAGGFPISLRGDTIFFLGRKVSGVRERYPEEFYELTGTQRQRREVQAADSAAESAPSSGEGTRARPKVNPPARVLVVHEIMPEYDRSGSEQRHWQVLQALRALGHEVTYVARFAVDRQRYVVALEEAGINVYAHDVERLGYQGVSGRPRWTFEEVLNEGRFDVAFLLTWFWTGISIPEQYLDEIRRVSPGTRIVTVCDDPHGPRELALARLSGKLTDLERAIDFEQREKEIYPLADLVVTVSDTNRRNLLEMSPNLEIEILPNEAESLIDSSPQPGFEARKDLLFLGDFANLANRDGLVWFMKEAWPSVRRKLPGIQLNLAGSNFTKGCVPDCAGVHHLGFVPDLKPLFGSHRIFVSPARYGISTRTKNLNALALGLPLVTSAAGAEGLFLQNEKEALLADSPGDFAEAVCRLYTDAKLWEALAENGRAHIRKAFSRERLETTLDQIIRRALSLHPKAYDPEHAWSAMLVEKRFPELKEGKSGKRQMVVRAICQLRMAEQFLKEGDPAAAREQVRHIFSTVYGDLARNDLGAKILLCLERCYTGLDETALAQRCKQEAQACILPSPSNPAPASKQLSSPAAHAGKKLRLSVIIPTFNRQSTLAACLAGLAQQTLPPGEFEVLVVDDGSCDGTEDFCREHKSSNAFRFLRQPNAGAGAARRLGVEHSRGEYVVLFNDDTIAAPTLLAEHLRAQQSDGREKLAVLGDFRLPPAAIDRALTHFLTQNPFLFPQVSMKPGVHSHSAYFITCNLSVRRDAVLAAGSFDPSFRVAEDTDLGIRLMRNGYRVSYVPQAFATHLHLPFTIADLLRRAETYAPAQLLLFKKHPQLLGDGAGPFGRLDEISIQKLREFVAVREREVAEAVAALEKFDSVDFMPFFSIKTGNRSAADEVMEAFARAVPDVYFFHLYRNFLRVWDEDSSAPAVSEAPPQPEEKEVRI